MFVCNRLLFATLRAVCANGKMEKVLFSDVLPFDDKKDAFFGEENDYWYDDSHVEVCTDVLLNDGFLFERNGFIYPSISSIGFVDYCVEYSFEIPYGVPFLTLVKKALKKANQNFIGE